MEYQRRLAARIGRVLPTNLSIVWAMRTVGFTYWQDGDFWLGHLDEFPDHLTQGTTLDELKEHLLDLHSDLSSGLIPGVRRHAELEIA